MEHKQSTVCFIRKGDEVLLALIEYGPDDQKWNGLGGVIELGESPAAAVVREIAEETELRLTESDLTYHGVIHTGKLPLHIFSASNILGRKSAIDPSIKRLSWFKPDAIPYQEMWPGNQDWLPQVLGGKRL